MAIKHLVLTDVDAIQSYVFSSVRMAMMVGASQIVRYADEKIKTLARHWGARPAVASGGIGLFVFDMQDDAQRFASRVKSHFAKVSVNGTLTASDIVPFDDRLGSDNPNGFARRRDEALASLDRRKRLGRALSESVGFGMAWNCETCGKERAVRLRQHADETWRVCVACDRRYKSRRQGNTRQLAYYGPCATLEDGTTLNVDIDLDTLAEGGHWALVVLDGDGFGDRLRTFDTPASFEIFSDNLVQLMFSAVSSGLQTIYSLRPGRAPAIVLFDGGDDIVIACRAEFALPFVRAFASRIQQEPNPGWANGSLGFSAGIAIVGVGFPFRTAHRIAEGLLRNAKRAAHKLRPNGDARFRWSEGAVDYAIVTESHADVTQLLDEREIADEPGRTAITFTGRPYRLALNTPRSLESLRSACSKLKSNDFPSSRLHDLRNHLTRSAITTHTSYTGIGVEALAEKMVLPFLKSWETRTCRSPSLAECWQEARLEGFDANAEFPQADLADAIKLWGDL